MSWLNLNQSLNSIKGQITNFANEVLSEGNAEDSEEGASVKGPQDKELEEKFREKDAEIEALKRLNAELQESLNSERFSKKNGVQDFDTTNWYAWDPPEKTQTQQVQHQKELDLMVPYKPDAGEQFENLSEVERLREENKNLAANLEDLDNQHQLAMEKLLLLKKELQKNFELLKDDHEDLKNTNEEYATEIKELLNKIGERDKEIESLKVVKADFETLYHKHQNLERIYGLLRENAEKFQEENQALHEEVFKLQEQVTKMEHDLEVATKPPDLSAMVPKFEYDEKVKELESMKTRKKDKPLYDYEINLDDNSKSVIENLKREIDELKHKNPVNETEITHEHKSVKSDKIQHFYDKYVNFEIPVDDVGAIPTGDDVVLYKLETVFKTVNLFKKEIDLLQHKLSEKDLNVLHLQTQLEDLTAENDFLTSDIQHLERELNETKKNNDFLIGEIAALKNTSTLEPIIESHEDNIVKLEAELADSYSLNSTFKETIARIEKELSKVRTEKDILQSSLVQLKSQYEEMQRGLEVCKSKTDEIEELERKVKSEDSRRLSVSEDSLKSRVSVLAGKNEQLAIDLHIVQNDKVLLTDKIQDLKQQLENKTATVNEMQEKQLKSEKMPSQDIESSKHAGKRSPPPEVDELFTENASVKCEIVHNSELEGINVRLKEIIEEVNNDLATMTHQKDELLNKVVLLKKENEDEKHTITELQQKCRNCINSISEAKMLKQTNNLLSTKYLALENSLAAAEKNISEFEIQLQNADKIIQQTKERDDLISKLNNTIEGCTVTNKRLEEDLITKYAQIDELRNSIEAVTAKLNEMKQNATDQNLYHATQLTEQRIQFQKELEDQSEQMEKRREDWQKQVNELIEERDSLKTQLQSMYNDAKRSHDAMEQLESEIQSAQEINVKCKLDDETKIKRDKDNQKECAIISQDNSFMEQQIQALNDSLVAKEKELTDLKAKVDSQEGCIQCRNVLERTSKEKSELIELLNLKHNESIQYHNEIQRLNNVLVIQTNEFSKLLDEKDKSQKPSDSNECCEKLAQSIVIKDKMIDSLNASLKDYEKVKEELAKTGLTIIGMKEHIAGLEKELRIQTDCVKNLTTENIKLSELEKSHKSELDRLRSHLVEKEDCQTSELLATEQKLNETLARLKQAEDKFKESNVVYISNSVRANQEIETLRNQIRLIEKQRDELQAMVNAAEDGRNKTEASLTNLQVVLEQFQIEKEKDIRVATEKLRNKIDKMQQENDRLQDEITIVNTKYEDTLAGLQAANRLGAQLDEKQRQIAEMKQTIASLQQQLSMSAQRYERAVSQHQDKVDKELVKNLLINYVTARGGSADTQVLRVLSTVLDCNQLECARLGLARGAGVGAAGAGADSLTQQFVRFLQDESAPRPRLPGMGGGGGSRRNSTMGPNPQPSPTPPPSHSRTPSASNNLLLNQLIDPNPNPTTTSQPDGRITVGQLDTGINQTRNSEGAILKQVLKDN